mgnify:CR=1 FL=1
MDKINAAVIGCGIISSAHLEAIKANEGKVELYAVCDIIKEKAQRCADQYGAKKVFTDYREMLSDDQIDLVCICTPSGMHSEMAVACAKAGKNVLCEKPLDITREKLDRMLRAFRETGMKLGSVLQYRTCKGLIKAKKLLDSNELGKILYANGHCKIYRSPEYYKSAGWRGTWDFDGGGCLMNQAICLSWAGNSPVYLTTGRGLLDRLRKNITFRFMATSTACLRGESKQRAPRR